MTKPHKHKFKPDVREIIDFGEALGFELTGYTRNNHIRLAIPDGGPVQIVPNSPSSPIWMKNARAELRRKARRWTDEKRRLEQKQERERQSGKQKH